KYMITSPSKILAAPVKTDGNTSVVMSLSFNMILSKRLGTLRLDPRNSSILLMITWMRNGSDLNSSILLITRMESVKKGKTRITKEDSIIVTAEIHFFHPRLVSEV